MSVNEVAINSPQIDLLSPLGVMLRPPLSVCWRMQTRKMDPSFREIVKISGSLRIQMSEERRKPPAGIEPITNSLQDPTESNQKQRTSPTDEDFG